MENISVIYVEAEQLTLPQKAFLRLAHWAIRLTDFELWRPEKNTENSAEKER